MEEAAEGDPANKEGPVLRDKKEKDIEKTPIMVTLRLEFIQLIIPCFTPHWDHLTLNGHQTIT